MVVGGGPAGIEAARVAAIRGHHVTVYEAADRLGGQLIPAIVPPYKQNLADYIPYMEGQAEYRGFTVELNHPITREEVARLKPDVVIVATGVLPAVLPIPGFDKPLVMNAKEALLGKPTGKNIVIIGGGTVGCETAEWMLDAGKSVTIVEMSDRLMGKMVETTRFVLKAHLRELNCRELLNTRCVEIQDQAVVVESAEGQQTIPADNVIIAVGDRPNNALANEIQDLCPEVITIGDAQGIGSVLEAVRTGYVAGKSI